MLLLIPYAMACIEILQLSMLVWCLPDTNIGLPDFFCILWFSYVFSIPSALYTTSGASMGSVECGLKLSEDILPVSNMYRPFIACSYSLNQVIHSHMLQTIQRTPGFHANTVDITRHVMQRTSTHIQRTAITQPVPPVSERTIAHFLIILS